jgi:DNA-binding response OmpR family regulator
MSSEINKCIFYRDLFGGWRWEWHDGEGQVRDSQYSYDSREDCVEAARKDGVYHSGPNGVAARVDKPLRSVLCAHPNAELQSFLLSALAGYRTVATGADALRAINSAVFDAYAIDYWLPDWSGVSLCREIRKLDPNAPVCFYTNARSDDARKRAMRAGANLFLVAPLEPQALRGHIERLVVMRDAASATAQAEETRAIEAELARRASAAIQVAEHAKVSVARAIERTARAKALKAFIDAGGTRANFERAFPHVYSTATVGFQVGAQPQRNA